MWKYYTAAKETGDIIDEFNTEKEAIEEIKKYEEADKKNGIFEENFYEVIEVEFISKV